MARPRRHALRAGGRRGLSVRRAAALGVVQGVAELVPVSSSAHVALLAGDVEVGRRRTLEVALHGGTALALPWVLRDVAARAPRAPGFHLAAAAPPVLVGAAAADLIERRAAGPRATAAGLLAGAGALVAAERAGGSGRPAPRTSGASAADGVALGLAQAAALVPGVSRRGATLAAARARGYDRAAASDLSWAAGLPVMLAAAARGVAVAALRGELRRDAPALTAGAAAAALTVVALAPARHALERVPYGAWAAWRAVVAAAAVRRASAAAGTLNR